MAPSYVNGSIAAIETGAYLPSGGTTGQILTKDSNADHDASWHIAPYAYFYFNSSGGQGGNRFNDWDDLFTALGSYDGPKKITFEQNETMPAGTYDMTDITLGGDQAQWNVKLTLADGVVFSTWTRGAITDGILVSSDSTSEIMSVTGGPDELVLVQVSAGICSQNTPFFVVDDTSTLILACSGGGAIVNAGAGAYGVAFFQTTNGNFVADQYSGFGLYSVSGSTATLVAETPNDTNLFKGGANAWASKNFSTPYEATAGVYAISMLSNRDTTSTLPLLAVPTQVVVSDIQKYAGSFPISGYVSGNSASNPASIDLTTLTSNNIRHLLVVI